MPLPPLADIHEVEAVKRWQKRWQWWQQAWSAKTDSRQPAANPPNGNGRRITVYYLKAFYDRFCRTSQGTLPAAKHPPRLHVELRHDHIATHGAGRVAAGKGAKVAVELLGLCCVCRVHGLVPATCQPSCQPLANLYSEVGKRSTSCKMPYLPTLPTCLAKRLIRAARAACPTGGLPAFPSLYVHFFFLEK